MSDDNIIVNVIFLVIRFLGLVLSGQLRSRGGRCLRILGKLLSSQSLSLVQDLDDDVARKPKQQDCKHDVQLHACTQVRTVCVRNDETCRFPQSVVTERSFLVSAEQCPIDPWNKQSDVITTFSSQLPLPQNGQSTGLTLCLILMH